MVRFIAAALLVLVASALPVEAAPTVAPTPEEALKRSREAEGRTLSGGHHFTDQSGRPVDLSQFRGKPLVISMIYTSCYHTCPVMTQTVAKAVDRARKALGEGKFQVVSIGFDTLHDTPANLKAYARQQGIDLDEWTFLAGDAPAIERLSGELGFTWYTSSRGFDHIAQTSVVDAEGKIYRQVYGENFDLPLLVEPLKDLVLGRASSLTSWTGLTNRVRIICTVYDPRSDAYRFDYGIFLEFGLGALSVATIAFLLAKLWRQRRTDLP